MASAAELKGRLETVEEIKSPADKFWAAGKEVSKLLPIIYPDVIKSIQDIIGDGKSPGSTRFLQFVEGHPLGNVLERIDSIDDEKMTFTYSVIGGDSMVGLYTKYQATVQIIPKGNGCVAKWAVQYEKVNEDVHDPYAAVDFISGVLHTLDEYVLKNN
ncbi:hypothetical protein MRB53_033929 [Persea americana]|uniref:Uncharacterized protein n=3 Tax=Persea americana TaxID=3435 RepID=A0ACC2KW56_PERAE|nr:hypothetical protein MRB53_033925 [Persea americana]KAJ8625397.1 hypothetical protein MRB53_033927 [Persea americana]KAJ8625399.1 hypothetical protein MRB53_033929 [Persea americana]